MKNSKSVPKRIPTKKTRKPVNSDKFYSTVWLSDYESWDMKSETGDPSTCVSSRATTPYSSRPTTPFDSKGSSPISSPPSSPFVARETYKGDDVFDSANPSETNRPHDAIQKPKPVKLKRTLSLPESELSQIEANDLQQRFTTLQLEQENQELKQLTDDLQDALENLEKRVHSVSESDQHQGGKTSDGRTPPYSSDDVFANDRVLPQRAMSEPSSPSSLSSHDTFVQSPKLSKPNSLDLSGNGARKRKHTEKLNSSSVKTRKTAKHKEDSICCITS
jgi:hypothetical protein